MAVKIDKSKPILVTGGGFIASWIVFRLLQEGHTVRATVRDKNNDAKVGHLYALAGRTSGKLTLYDADLTVEGSFDEAMQGVELLMHTASPFFIAKPKDAEKELIGPAKNGTRNVLNSATKSGTVKRVVLTSSVAAIMGDASDVNSIEGDTFNESHWNQSSSTSHNAYSYSKTLAEHEAWNVQKEQSQWDLVTINPAFVLGPALSGRMDSESVNFLKDMMNGKLRTGAPELTLGFVDVRDVAEAHLLAGFTPEAEGRHILAARTMTFVELAEILRESYPKYPLPRSTAPKFLLYFVGPLFGLSWKFVNENVGIAFELDNSRSRNKLGVDYRPVEDTLKDAVEQLKKARAIKER